VSWSGSINLQTNAYSLDRNIPQPSPSIVTSSSHTDSAGDVATGLLSADLSDPSISAVGTGFVQSGPTNGFAVGSGAADADLIYSFEITGPSASVEVLVDASLGVAGSPDRLFQTGSADAAFVVDGGALQPIYEELALNDDGYSSYTLRSTTGSSHVVTAYPADTTSASLSVDGDYLLSTDTVYTVEIAAEAQGSSGDNALGIGGGITTFSAFVDPTFDIDPGAPNAEDYSIQFSSGIGNSLTVPDTACTFTLAFLSFIGLAAVRRRFKLV
jgi:hypothetical protein